MSSIKFTAVFTFGVVVGSGQLTIQSVGEVPDRSPGYAPLPWRDALLGNVRSHHCSHWAQKHPLIASFGTVHPRCVQSIWCSFCLLHPSPTVSVSFFFPCFSCRDRCSMGSCNVPLSQCIPKAHAFPLPDARCCCLQQRLMVFSGPGSAGQLSYSLQLSSVKVNSNTYTIILSNTSSVSSHFCFEKINKSNQANGTQKMSLQCKTGQLYSPKRQNLTFQIYSALLQIYYSCFF